MGYVKGTISKDLVSINDLSATHSFVLSGEDKNLNNLISDGILGLAFNKFSPGYPTFIESLKSQGLIKNGIFSIYLSENEYYSKKSALTIGGYDSDYYGSGKEMVFRIENEFGYWTTSINSISFGNVKYDDYTFAILDSGTSIIMGPNKQVDSIFSQLRLVATCYSDEKSGLFVCECGGMDSDDFPTLYLSMEGHVLKITPKNYIFYSRSVCYIAINYSNDFY